MVFRLCLYFFNSEVCTFTDKRKERDCTFIKIDNNSPHPQKSKKQMSCGIKLQCKNSKFTPINNGSMHHNLCEKWEYSITNSQGVGTTSQVKTSIFVYLVFACSTHKFPNPQISQSKLGSTKSNKYRVRARETISFKETARWLKQQFLPHSRCQNHLYPQNPHIPENRSTGF